MMDEPGDSIPSPKATPATADEIAAYEKAVRDLIRFKSPFDKQLQYLDDLLSEKERQAPQPVRQK